MKNAVSTFLLLSIVVAASAQAQMDSETNAGVNDSNCKAISQKLIDVEQQLISTEEMLAQLAPADQVSDKGTKLYDQVDNLVYLRDSLTDQQKEACQ